MTQVDDKTLADLGWGAIREAWSRRCHTTRAAERIAGEPRGWLDLDAAREQLAQIEQARGLRDEASELPFGGISDIRVALARAAKGATLDPGELVDVARTARGCSRLADAIATAAEAADTLRKISRGITELGHVYHPILESFDDDGRLSDHASDVLGRLRKKVAKLIGELDRRAHKLIEDPSISPHLQDRFYTQRDERYVVPVKVESRGRVAGIVHGTSGSGQTVFIEPQELVELNNELKLAECEVADEERRIYAQLSAYIAEEVDALRAGADAATRLDEIDAAARLAADLGASTPVLEPGGPLSLSRARHPLMLLAGKPCVPNDIDLGAGQTLVISGPNAGGKTVALKTAGLAALMASAGLPVCADHASALPWLDHISSDIGDSQSLEQDLSTFSARLLHLADFLNHAAERSLILIDEIAMGTEPEQGAALAQAVLETLAGRHVMVIVTTHYERLKLLAGDDSPFVNASVGYDLDRLEPTFELTIGPPGSSGALRVARRMGLARTVLARAEALLGDQRASVESLIKSLEDDRRELAVERDAVAAERRELAESIARAESAEAAARERARKARESAHDQATAALVEARRELDAIKERVRARATSLKDAERQVDAASRSIAEHAPAPPERGRAAAAGELGAGDVVYVASLGSRATVLAPPSDQGKVVVSLGALKTTVDVSEVRIESGGRKKSPARGSVTVSRAPAADNRDTPVRTADATLDLRGQRAVDAVSELDRFVDQSILSSRDVIFVIHGHGTGALRTAVRAHLESSPVVAQWRAADPKEGGDGVTIAFLDV